jgi:hypothetical protein
MSEIVNLRRVKKARARALAAAQADANRIKHGAPKAARKLADARTTLQERELEAHRLPTRDGGD